MSSSQPSPYGSLFTRSGWSASASLTAVTVPFTGANRSLTLLVDSSSPQASPARTVEPTSGSCTYTMSPSWSCAKSVMPTRTGPSSPAFSHSCSAVYFRSSGYTFVLFLLRRAGSRPSVAMLLRRVQCGDRDTVQLVDLGRPAHLRTGHLADQAAREVR